jgi:hypothetical protein
MKILSRILIAFLILFGIAFLLLQNRASAAGKVKCQGNFEMRFGLDENGCEQKEPLHATQAQVNAWLKNAHVGPECYRRRFYVDHHLVAEDGELDLVQCIHKEGAESKKLHPFQPLGTSMTQRVMFNTSAAKDAFEKQSQAVESKSKKK